MTPGSPSLSVKSSSSLQPTTTNESLIMIFSQMGALKNDIDSVKTDADNKIKELEKSISELEGTVIELEKNLAVEARDKQILGWVVVVVIPIVLTIAQIVLYVYF